MQGGNELALTREPVLASEVTASRSSELIGNSSDTAIGLPRYGLISVRRAKNPHARCSSGVIGSIWFSSSRKVVLSLSERYWRCSSYVLIPDQFRFRS